MVPSERMQIRAGPPDQWHAALKVLTSTEVGGLFDCPICQLRLPDSVQYSMHCALSHNIVLLEQNQNFTDSRENQTESALYNVESILGLKYSKDLGRFLVKIKWERQEHCTWELISSLSNVALRDAVFHEWRKNEIREKAEM